MTADRELSALRKMAKLVKVMTAGLSIDDAAEHARRFPGTTGPGLHRSAARTRDLMIHLRAAETARREKEEGL